MREGKIGFARSTAAALLVAAFFVFPVGGCGGGGASGTSADVQGAATVGISVASVPAAGTVFSATTTTADGSAAPSAPAFDSILATIVKVALVPGDGDEGPDPDGEPLEEDDGANAHGHVDFALQTPVVIDLLHLPSPDSSEGLLGLLASIPEVPPGSYGKIRLFYSRLEGVRDGETIPFHPTANSRFDVHFVDGPLVVPLPAGPEGAVAFLAVQIRFVGLKIVENANKVLMRPQVFAVVEDLLFSVAGTAQNVDKGTQRFEIVPEQGEPVPVAYDGGTGWAIRDGSTEMSVEPSEGIAALNDGAIVEAIGRFGGGGVLEAEGVFITMAP